MIKLKKLEDSMLPDQKKKWAWLGLALTVAIFGAIVYMGMRSVPSVGIIGGADGPTAIFLTGPEKGVNWLEVGLLLAAGALVIWLIIRENKKGVGK